MKSKEKKIILGFLHEKSNNFFNKATFFYFPFFLCHQTSAILGSILLIILNFLNFLYYFGNMCCFTKKIKFLFFYTVCTNTKSYVYRGGGVAGPWAGTVFSKFITLVIRLIYIYINIFVYIFISEIK